ncbi:stage II sporulation protein M [Methanosphaera sp.]
MKKYVLIAVILFIISIILGVLFVDSFKPFLIEIINNLIEETPTIEVLSLFQHNLQANILIMIGGIFFSVFSIFTLIVNGAVLGSLSTFTSLDVYLLYIIPHGIFEFIALFISFATALIITKLIIRIIKGLFYKELTVKKQLNESINLIKAIIMSIIIVTILLAIASVIETYITTILAETILAII